MDIIFISDLIERLNVLIKQTGDIPICVDTEVGPKSKLYLNIDTAEAHTIIDDSAMKNMWTTVCIISNHRQMPK